MNFVLSLKQLQRKKIPDFSLDPYFTWQFQEKQLFSQLLFEKIFHVKFRGVHEIMPKGFLKH